MQTSAPVLLVDVGGTLIVRTKPGPFARAAQVLAEAGVDVTDPAVRDAIGRCLLTGDDRATATARLIKELRLSTDASTALGDALRSPEGEAVILDGAESLLKRATAAGWQVIAVTNAARWSEPLPDQLHRHITRVVSSSDLGLLKQDPAFWRHAVATCGIDVRRSLVVGDNPVADGSVPAGLGLCAVVHAAAGPSVAQVSDWLAALPPPPPDLVGLLAGSPMEWGGQRIIEAPHLAALVVSVTRCRVRVHPPEGRAFTTTVVRRRGLPPAVLMPAREHVGGLLWLSSVPDRRSSVMPDDLAEALWAAGVSLDGLSERERRHLVSMAREAKDPTVREMRIADIVAFAHRHRAQSEGRMSDLRSAAADPAPAAADLFAGTAEYYARYRPAYPSALLDAILERATPARPRRLLDLGCGTGELLLPLSRYFDEAHGVDPSAEMVRCGREKAASYGATTVEWSVCRAEDFSAPSAHFNLVVIGAAFHWMDRHAVAARILDWLRPGGSVAVAGVNSVWNGTEEWQRRAVAVIKRWLGEERRAGSGTFRDRPERHEDVLRAAGLVSVTELTFPTTYTWSLDEFIGYLYSTSFASRAVLGDRQEHFEADLRNTLLSYDPSGRYTETLRFHCIVGGKP